PREEGLFRLQHSDLLIDLLLVVAQRRDVGFGRLRAELRAIDGEGENRDHDDAGDHQLFHHATPSSCLRPGSRGPSSGGSAQAGASVRSAQRSLAERERGLASTSVSLGSIALRWRTSKVGGFPFGVPGRWREADGVWPERARKNSFTMRSSIEWKVTTTSRP